MNSSVVFAGTVALDTIMNAVVATSPMGSNSLASG
jgi:hypothetical protein